MTRPPSAWERVEALPREGVVARWRAESVHAKSLLALAWSSAAAMPFLTRVPRPAALVWTGAVTVAFGFLVLLRWNTELRTDVVVTGEHVYVRYRGGVVERVDLERVRGAELVTRRDRRWVFHLGRGASLALPDYHATRAVVARLRERARAQGG